MKSSPIEIENWKPGFHFHLKSESVTGIDVVLVNLDFALESLQFTIHHFAFTEDQNSQNQNHLM